MQIKFTKMQGLGNDFVVLDRVTQCFELEPEHLRKLGDRHFGVGCDQILVVEPPQQPDVDFRYRIFNADGSEVQQCGNGARCFARFIREKKLSAKNPLRVETAGGIIELFITRRGTVRVDMGAPILEPAQIPFQADAKAERYNIDVDGESLELSAVSMGNPHAVLLVDDVDKAPVERLGPLLESHPRFPERVNVGFMQVESPSSFRLRVFERGVGETLACGSGACAAMVAGRQLGLLDEKVDAQLRGGPLQLSWRGPGQAVMMTGPAYSVYEGQIKLD